jgi:hypothetical protein
MLRGLIQKVDKRSTNVTREMESVRKSKENATYLASVRS